MGSEILWRARGRKTSEGWGRATPFLPRQVYCAHRCPRPGLPPKRKSDVAHLEIRDIPRGGAGVGVSGTEISRGMAERTWKEEGSSSFIASVTQRKGV